MWLMFRSVDLCFFILFYFIIYFFYVLLMLKMLGVRIVTVTFVLADIFSDFLFTCCIKD